MKKILLSGLAIILAMGLMGSSFAYFSDIETSEGNTFTAGTFDCELVHMSAALPFLAYGEAPGWESDGVLQGLRNLGSLEGKVCITADAFTEPVEIEEPDGGEGVNGLEVGPKDFADVVRIVVSYTYTNPALLPEWEPYWSGSLRDLDTCSDPLHIGAAGSGNDTIWFTFVASLPTDLNDEDDTYEDTPPEGPPYDIPGVNGNEYDDAYQADGVRCDIVFYGTTEEIIPYP